MEETQLLKILMKWSHDYQKESHEGPRGTWTVDLLAIFYFWRIEFARLIPHFCSFFSSSSHYENTPIQIYRKFHLQKTENFQIKNSDIFHISAQNIDCGYSLEPPRRGSSNIDCGYSLEPPCRGGSNEYPQSMFWAEIWKLMYTPVNPSFII